MGMVIRSRRHPFMRDLVIGIGILVILLLEAAPAG